MHRPLILIPILLAGCGTTTALPPTSTVPPRTAPPSVINRTPIPTPSPPAASTASATPAVRATTLPGGTRPSPTARVLVPSRATAVPGRPALRAVLVAFNLALLTGNTAEAQGYLTPQLRAQVPPQDVLRALHLTAPPRRYTYRILPRAEVIVTYTTAHGPVTDRLIMVETEAGRRIAAIHGG